MTHLVDDVRLALRGFRKTPGVTAVIVLALALGIGVNASCFVYISGLLLHPFPYPQLDRIMTVWDSPASHPGERGAVCPREFPGPQRQQHLVRGALGVSALECESFGDRRSGAGAGLSGDAGIFRGAGNSSRCSAASWGRMNRPWWSAAVSGPAAWARTKRRSAKRSR